MLLEEFYRSIECSEEDVQLRLTIARNLHELESKDYIMQLYEKICYIKIVDLEMFKGFK